jgi:hypothetical protein
MSDDVARETSTAQQRYQVKSLRCDRCDLFVEFDVPESAYESELRQEWEHVAGDCGGRVSFELREDALTLLLAIFQRVLGEPMPVLDRIRNYAVRKPHTQEAQR